MSTFRVYQPKNAIDDLNMDAMNEVIQNMEQFHFSQDAEKLFQKLSQAADSLDVDACEDIMCQWEKLN